MLTVMGTHWQGHTHSQLTHNTNTHSGHLYPDGMAQIHCQLSHQEHLADFLVKLPQQIQGVLVHNKLMDIYRTFHLLVNNANADIRSFLITLE